MPGFRARYPVFFLIAAAVVAADQVTKAWIRAHLEIGETLWRYGILSITHVTPNTGASFGMFQGYMLPLIIVTAIFMVLLLVFVFKLYKQLPWIDRGIFWVALGLIMGGSIGNFIDRVHPVLEGVTDFVSIGRFPTFNVADSGVTVGAVLFVLGFLIYGRDGLSTGE